MATKTKTPTVTVKEKKVQGTPVGFEGTVSLQGLKNTKLTRKDGTTVFSTKSALSASVRSLAKRTGLDFETVPTTTATKKAAKKSSTCKSKKTSTCKK
jgi:hypothetical protein